MENVKELTNKKLHDHACKLTKTVIEARREVAIDYAVSALRRQHGCSEQQARIALFAAEEPPKDQDKKYTYKTINVEVMESEDLVLIIKKESEYQGELGWRLVQVLGNGSNHRNLLFVKEYTDVSTDSGS